MRIDGRSADQMRSLKITPDFISSAEGSVLIELGNTRVICTATVDDGVPSFLKGSGKGWVTSEYGMLPRATEQRTPREAARGKQSGRTLEIQRLIGRSLRAVTDQKALGERTVWLDCDVIQADALFQHLVRGLDPAPEGRVLRGRDAVAQQHELGARGERAPAGGERELEPSELGARLAAWRNLRQAQPRGHPHVALFFVDAIAL